MPDPISQPLSLDEDPRPIDWDAAAPMLDLRWFVGAALLMPLLLAAGVYWLHQVPAGPGPHVSGEVVEVRLLTVVEQAQHPQEEPIRPNVVMTALQPERVTEDPRRAIPEDAVAALTAEPIQSSTPSSTPANAPLALTRPNLKASAFQRALLTHIARYRHYPEQARSDRVQGTVQLVFAMRRDGMVTDVWIKGSSGHKNLDAAAVDTIRKAQPLPSIPAELPDVLNVAIPVGFDLP